MGNYSKLIGALVGNIVAIGLAYAATRGLGTCDAEGACMVAGFTGTQITAALMLIVNAIAVHQFPANKA